MYIHTIWRAKDFLYGCACALLSPRESSHGTLLGKTAGVVELMKMSRNSVVCLLLGLAALVYSCQPPDCDHPDCGTCGTLPVSLPGPVLRARKSSVSVCIARGQLPIVGDSDRKIHTGRVHAYCWSLLLEVVVGAHCACAESSMGEGLVI